MIQFSLFCVRFILLRLGGSIRGNGLDSCSQNSLVLGSWFLVASALGNRAAGLWADIRNAKNRSWHGFGGMPSGGTPVSADGDRDEVVQLKGKCCGSTAWCLTDNVSSFLAPGKMLRPSLFSRIEKRNGSFGLGSFASVCDALKLLHKRQASQRFSSSSVPPRLTGNRCSSSSLPSTKCWDAVFVQRHDSIGAQVQVYPVPNVGGFDSIHSVDRQFLELAVQEFGVLVISRLWWGSNPAFDCFPQCGGL